MRRGYCAKSGGKLPIIIGTPVDEKETQKKAEREHTTNTSSSLLLTLKPI